METAAMSFCTKSVCSPCSPPVSNYFICPTNGVVLFLLSFLHTIVGVCRQSWFSCGCMMIQIYIGFCMCSGMNFGGVFLNYWHCLIRKTMKCELLFFLFNLICWIITPFSSSSISLLMVSNKALDLSVTLKTIKFWISEWNLIIIIDLTYRWNQILDPQN